MELVGRAVKKAFQGFGIFSGLVESYDPASGYYRIVYEDGDSEEMELEELTPFLVGNFEGSAEELVRPKKRGRKPKKRRRVVEMEANSDISGIFLDPRINCCDAGEVPKRTSSISNGNVSAVEVETGLLKDTSGASFDLNLESASIAVVGDVAVKDCCFDLNVEGNGPVRIVERPEKRPHDFDLNLEGNPSDCFAELEANNFLGFEVDLNGSASMKVFEDRQVKGTGSAGGIEECTSVGFCEETQARDGNFCGYFEGTGADIVSEFVKEAEQKTGGNDENLKENSGSGITEDTPIDGVDLGENLRGDALFMQGNGVVDESRGQDSSCPEIHLNRASSNISPLENLKRGEGSLTIHIEGDGRKKRRKLGEKPDATDQTPLRRSARRATASLSSPFKFDEKFASFDYAVSEENCSLPPKLKLPPSTQNLNLDNLPVFDIFSVYACLRSFSTLLFLSPFTLETFVAALKCNFANSLIDSIHLSILQLLKLHLEFLSGEGSPSASDCLRNLNWMFLDSITWPVYLVEYLMICPPGFKQNFELCDLKLLNGEYYKQSAQIKLEILRCICDDVVGTEAMRSEIDRRALGARADILDSNRPGDSHLKRKDSVDDFGNLGLTEVVDEMDPNNDECCLCKMDGSLICCDGCPAAYHLKCMGMTKDLLPEGNWYCLECAIKRQDGWMKNFNPVRGADLLGIDPHGRLYFGSCGYLLVSELCEEEASYHYYGRNDVPAVIEVISADASYSCLVSAISSYWDVGSHSAEVKDEHCSGIDLLDTTLDLLSLDVKNCDASKGDGAVGLKGICYQPEGDAFQRHINAETICKPHMAEVSRCMEMGIPIVGSEVSVKSGTYSPETKNIENMPLANGELPLICGDSDRVQEKSTAFPLAPGILVAHPKKEAVFQMTIEPGSYINYYSFGQMAFAVAQELHHEASNVSKDPSKNTNEEMVSQQLKIISKKCTKFCWLHIHNSQNARTENCGWCILCRSSNDQDCLFNTSNKKVVDDPKGSAVGFRTRRSKRSHLSSVIHHILSIEDRLNGLLSGPWEDPQYCKLWRKKILKASDVASVKRLLLLLESNLRRVALSPEWLKQVDSAVIVGSAAHIFTNSVNVSSKQGGGKKRARRNMQQDAESIFVSQIAAKSGIHWWRGGRLSRQLFNWKMLPQLLASVGARQGGCKKIPGVFYPDGSDFAKRSKYVAWRAGVEKSVSVAQLAYQIRDLDGNIRWRDLANSDLFPKVAKESKKLSVPLKNITIRKKCVEGTQVKYLLDFGKRKLVPETVSRHGVLSEEPSTRTKYWLSESHVPLYLLRAFEQRKLARKLCKKNKNDKTSFGLLIDENHKKPSREKGLSYLLSKGQKVEQSKLELVSNCGKRKMSTRQRGVSNSICKGEKENYLCGHCKKDIPVRDALKCRSCKGFFHKRHIKASKSPVTNKQTYTCFECMRKKPIRITRSTRRTSQKKKSKISRKPSSKRKRPKLVKNGQLDGRKTVTKCASRHQSKTVVEEPTGKTWHKGQRTKICHAYWLNGVHWAGKLKDGVGIRFREKKVLLPLVLPAKPTSLEPICSLCHGSYNSGLIYIGCENCEEWFHGDAFRLAVGDIHNIIGFHCHNCRSRTAPTCPHSANAAAQEIRSCNDCDNEEIECPKGECNHMDVPSEMCPNVDGSMGLIPVVNSTLTVISEQHAEELEKGSLITSSIESKTVPIYLEPAIVAAEETQSSKELGDDETKCLKDQCSHIDVPNEMHETETPTSDEPFEPPKCLIPVVNSGPTLVLEQHEEELDEGPLYVNSTESKMAPTCLHSTIARARGTWACKECSDKETRCLKDQSNFVNSTNEMDETEMPLRDRLLKGEPNVILVVSSPQTVASEHREEGVEKAALIASLTELKIAPICPHTTIAAVEGAQPSEELSDVDAECLKDRSSCTQVPNEKHETEIPRSDESLGGSKCLIPVVNCGRAFVMEQHGKELEMGHPVGSLSELGTAPTCPCSSTVRASETWSCKECRDKEIECHEDQCNDTNAPNEMCETETPQVISHWKRDQSA